MRSPSCRTHAARPIEQKHQTLISLVLVLSEISFCWRVLAFQSICRKGVACAVLAQLVEFHAFAAPALLELDTDAAQAVIGGEQGKTPPRRRNWDRRELILCPIARAIATGARAIQSRLGAPEKPLRAHRGHMNMDIPPFARRCTSCSANPSAEGKIVNRQAQQTLALDLISRNTISRSTPNERMRKGAAEADFGRNAPRQYPRCPRIGHQQQAPAGEQRKESPSGPGQKCNGRRIGRTRQRVPTHAARKGPQPGRIGQRF